MSASEEKPWRQRRRDRLIDAARRVFAAQGFERASMEEIAAAAGAGKPTLYRYFASKDALFDAVFVTALDQLDASLAAAERTSGEPRQALQRMVAALVPLFREHVVTLRGVSAEAGSADLARRRLLRQRAGTIEGRLAAVLARGRERGAFRHGDDRLMARLIYGMVWSGSAASGWSDAAVVAAIVALVAADGDARPRRPRGVLRNAATAQVPRVEPGWPQPAGPAGGTP